MSIEPRRIKKIVRKLRQEMADDGYRESEVMEEVPLKKETLKKSKKTYRTRKVSEGHTYALTKPRAVEGYVTLTQLAAERGIQPQLARIWMKKAGWVTPGLGWQWKEKSRDLTRVCKVLGLEP